VGTGKRPWTGLVEPYEQHVITEEYAMSIVVTGATGHLGRSVVESLLERGVAAETITATGRAVEKIADLAERGVRVLRADLTDPASLDAAFAGASKVLLVSSSTPGQRLAEHCNAIDAAVRAGVAHLVYTSIPQADTTKVLLAQEHTATEEALAASGLTTTILRNGWYVENYTGQVETFTQHGMVGAAGDGKVSVALRKEYGEAAAAVLTGTGHEGKVYELGGEAVTLTEIAEAISQALGVDIAYTDVPVDTLRGILESAGLPAPAAEIFSDVDRGIAAGELLVPETDLTALLGRTPTRAADAIGQALV
jgi:NAD(P)H dehydrogenase (quinone)